jgi:hypothetical protein
MVIRAGDPGDLALRDILRFVVLVVFLEVCTVGGAIADASGPDFFRVTGVAATDVLNIREAPDAGSVKIGEIPPDGDGIRNLGCQGGLSFGDAGSASLTIQTPFGKERILNHAAGSFTDPSGDRVSVQREGHLWRVTVGEEHYEIPNAALTGD